MLKLIKKVLQKSLKKVWNVM